MTGRLRPRVGVLERRRGQAVPPIAVYYVETPPGYAGDPVAELGLAAPGTPCIYVSLCNPGLAAPRRVTGFGAKESPPRLPASP